ncbi:hypothetical protein [Clostridium folliculivorans]|uniref:Uncharacterized protein n=1 Tax=Clostridium folliculivorans TaxID=2886038 RepID=A0A9W6DA20_9CLOT|nr:hypothetical protein [Clostridium folliculivorans]GKU24930.1 hypothetical protein CFOLD11_17560 [Clostridium folliculivorans]GKU31028.1 hypothetical protein CFB3_31350 [Clostridium folliculivorans]
MKKTAYFKPIIFIFLIVLFSSSFIYLQGYRLSPMKAAEAALEMNDNIQKFGEVKRDWGNVLLLKTSKGLKTALVMKQGLLWHCNSTIYFFDDAMKNDLVKTVGWESFSSDNSKQITVLAVENNDPNVKVIKAGTGSDIQSKSISLGVTVIFTWDKMIQSSNLNPVAFDKSDSPVYKYQYNPKDSSSIHLDELKWYPVNNQ